VPGDLGHCALSAALTRLAGRADLAALSGYQPHAGSDAQRAAGARWLATTGVVADPSEITICGGAQHATAVVLSALATPGGVLVEELTHAGVLAAAGWLRLPTHPVALDDQGLLPDALAAACRRSGAKVLYCIPTNHNPTTAVMPLSRRKAIAAVCRTHDVTIIENGTLAPLVAHAPPPLAALVPERTHYIASLAKATLPALRIGFIRSPAAAQALVERGVAATLWSTSPLLTDVAVQWIEDGTAEAIRDARRTEAAARQAIARSALAGHAYRAHATAYFVWMPIGEERRGLEIVERAAAENVLIGPAHLFAARAGNAPNAVRLSLVGARSRDELRRGLDIVARILGEP
jgi:DNA-binding transcriptional MocR family regulator